MPDLFTVGYEGRTPDELARLLRENGVALVADVRELPLSRRKGFSKTALAARLAEDRIGYVHLRALGSPRDVRHAYRDEGGGYEAFARAYAAHLDTVPSEVDRLGALARAAPTALLCVERQAEDCHRGILVERLAPRGFRRVDL